MCRACDDPQRADPALLLSVHLCCAYRALCATLAPFRLPAERVLILKELEPRLLELCKSPYGHFVVSKLIALASKDQLPGGWAGLGWAGWAIG